MSARVHPLASFLAGLAGFVSGVRPVWAGSAPWGAQRVYFANHSSHLDAVVLWASLPPALRARTRPVVAADYWRGNRFRCYLAERVFRAVLIERGDPATGAAGVPQAILRREQTLAAMLDALDDGSSLILFPEGTRGDGCRIGRFRSGLYHLSLRRPGVELVPVWLDNLNRILPKGEVLPVPLLGRAVFGPPLRLGEGEERAMFLARARAAVARLKEV